jgi:hypothetical protein
MSAQKRTRFYISPNEVSFLINILTQRAYEGDHVASNIITKLQGGITKETAGLHQAQKAAIDKAASLGFFSSSSSMTQQTTQETNELDLAIDKAKHITDGTYLEGKAVEDYTDDDWMFYGELI